MPDPAFEDATKHGAHMSDFTASLRQLIYSPGFKFFLIGFLILLLLIPLFMVMGLISEREGRSREVKNEVARTWGAQQNLSGPYLVVPYAVMVESYKGKERIERKDQRFGVFLPEELKFDVDTKAKVLKRSIFDVNVYTANMKLSGNFAKPDIRTIDPNAIDVRWNDTIVALALSDVSGLKDSAALKIDGQSALKFEPSIGIANGRQSGIHARLKPISDATVLGINFGEPPSAFTFQIDLVFTGSDSLYVAPAGRLTTAQMTSDWPHPSFTGGFLPATRTISADGFKASWQVPHLARSIPQSYQAQRTQIDRFGRYNFGVRYYAPVDFYALVSRAAKYGILFLSFAFMAVFVMEMVAGQRIHAVQYIFVGLAMIFFYVLLLSFSEHIGFAKAYVTASLATGGMLAIYFSKAFKSVRFGVAAAALFVVIYGLLYMILRLEDYALLTGALLGFAALTAVMFMTLKVDWTKAAAKKVTDPPVAT